MTESGLPQEQASRLVLPAYLREDGQDRRDGQGRRLVTFFEGMRPAPHGKVEKVILIDGELLDWSIDASSLMDAQRMAKKLGPHILQEAKRSIERHFIESVSEVVGRHVTREELLEARRTGFIATAD